MRFFLLAYLLGLGCGLFGQERRNALYIGPELNALSSAGYFCPGVNLKSVFHVSDQSSVVPSISVFSALAYNRNPLFIPATIGYRFSFKRKGRIYMQADGGIISATDVWNTHRFTKGLFVLGIGTQGGKRKTTNEMGIKYGYTSSRDTRFLNFFFVFGIPLK